MVVKQVTVTLQGNKYKIGFPNIGQIIDIEVAKVNYSKGSYQGLVNSMSKTSSLSLDFIDAIATFFIVIPELSESLSIQNVFQLDPFKAQELVVQYKKVYFPWYAEIVKELHLKEEELSKIYDESESDKQTKN